jgi:hypothetical protein
MPSQSRPPIPAVAGDVSSAEVSRLPLYGGNYMQLAALGPDIMSYDSHEHSTMANCKSTRVLSVFGLGNDMG